MMKDTGPLPSMGDASPGIEIKETFLPLSQLIAQAQVTDTVSLTAQYHFDRQQTRFPEGGIPGPRREPGAST